MSLPVPAARSSIRLFRDLCNRVPLQRRSAHGPFRQRSTSTPRHHSSDSHYILLTFESAAPMEYQAFPQVDDYSAAVDHNKLQVTLQAWLQHPDLHEKIAYGIYEFGHNLTKTSVRCEHFLPHGVAVEINYSISTYSHFLEHFKGWRQLLQELLGPDYGKCMISKSVSVTESLI